LCSSDTAGPGNHENTHLTGCLVYQEDLVDAALGYRSRSHAERSVGYLAHARGTLTTSAAPMMERMFDGNRQP
jgi:hypothetical protein